MLKNSRPSFSASLSNFSIVIRDELALVWSSGSIDMEFRLEGQRQVAFICGYCLDRDKHDRVPLKTSALDEIPAGY